MVDKYKVWKEREKQSSGSAYFISSNLVVISKGTLSSKFIDIIDRF
jgi:hypothetical protein